MNNWNITQSDMPDDEFDKLREEFNKKHKPRKKWPWSKMEVKDVHTFDRTKISFQEVERASCMYGNAMGKKFITKFDGTNLTVTRIA